MKPPALDPLFLFFGATGCLALDMAKEVDCLLIAGKGHETYQEFADTIVPFDDRQVVRELIGIKSIKPA